MKMLPLPLFLLLLLAVATAAHTDSRRQTSIDIYKPRACVATCTSGPNKGKRFLNALTCRTISDNCATQFAGTDAGNQVQSDCEYTKYTIEEFFFDTAEVCETFTQKVMAPVIQNAGTPDKPQYAGDKSVQTEVGCGCKDLVGQFLGTIDDSTGGPGIAGSFCNYLEGRVKAAATNSVCSGSKSIPIFGSLCEMVVGEVAGEALGPAFQSFCGQIVEIGKSDFGLNLDSSFVEAKEYADRLADRVCGQYLCPGPFEGVCELVTDARDVAISLASAMCQATAAAGAENSTSGGGSSGGLCFPADALVILEDGTTKQMKDIQITDILRVGKDQYSEVFMWTHRIEDGTFTFLNITHSYGNLVVTADHYIYANGHPTAARFVKPGDLLPVVNGDLSYVSHVSTTSAIGLYNPHTRHGDLVVNGVITTTYSDVVHPAITKTFMSAAQLAPGVVQWALGDNIKKVPGVPWWVAPVFKHLPAGSSGQTSAGAV